MEIGELVAAVERVSSGYAARFDITRDADWFLLKLHEELGELTQAHLMLTGQARTKGRTEGEIDQSFRAEVADVLSHALLLARHHGIDVVEEVRRKWLVWADTGDDTRAGAPEE